MPYLGNVPAEAYSQVSYQDLTGGSGTSFTLNYAVGSAGEIEVFVNNVRQEPTVAYTVSGTSLTMTGSIAATDDFYVVFQGKAQQTIGIPEKQTDGTYVFGDSVTINADLTVDTNTLYVDSANNRVGIGTTSPARNVSIVDSSVPLLQLALSTDQAAGNGFELAYDGVAAYLAQRENLPMVFKTNDVEAMRIDNSQRLLVGKTSGGSIGTFGNELGSAGYAMHSRSGGTPLFIGRAVSTGSFCDFYYGASTPSGFVGSISTNGSSTSYNTTSDYRLKENVVDLTGASDRVNQIPVHRFNFISDPDTTVDGFLAHEVQAVVPEAISGTQDEVDEEGNPVYQQIDQAKIVPLLTAALQEALAKIETLETEMTSVKARLDALETP
jgi:hypothetical protein